MPRIPIPRIPQLTALKHIKAGDLPEIPDDFEVRSVVKKNPKAKPLSDDIHGYLSYLSNWLSVATEAPTLSGEGKKLYGDPEANERFIADILDKVNETFERCLHHMMYPEKYTSKEAIEAMTLYWQLATMFAPEERALKDIEYYSPGRGISQYYARDAGKFCENSNKSREYYELLTRFAHKFPFSHKMDRRCFVLYVEGFDPRVISMSLAQPLNWVVKKIDYYKGIALRNREEFLRESVGEAEGVYQ